ncbi:metal-sensing transcriptional repressor [Candidatus Dojkabacteria bacterium]|nr:metal-sensing transcriptional repressor [Candidatus Dojkabacteria bacterium]
MPKKGKSSLEDRLHRIEGQIRGVESMVEGESDLSKVIVQLQAVISALESVKLEIVKRKIKTSVEDQVLGALELLK